jgi:hypothetical protein
MSSIQANAMRMPLIALLVFVVRVLPSGNETLRGIRARSLLIVGGTGLLGMGLGAYLFIYAITQANPAGSHLSQREDHAADCLGHVVVPSRRLRRHLSYRRQVIYGNLHL